MKIEYARGIPLAKILLKAGLRPLKPNGPGQHFRSPFSEKKSVRLVVDTAANTWTDTGTGQGGDTIDFVMCFLELNGEHHTVADCLRWIKNMLHQPVKADLSPFPDYTAEDKRYQLRGILPLSNFLLLRYLGSRQISRELASLYLKEVRVFDTREQQLFRALGLRNEEGGFAIRNSFHKAHTAPATISFIRGRVPGSGRVHLFKDIFDFLSVLVQLQRKQLREDSIILNSYSCLNDVMPYISGYGYSAVQTWLPNDEAGRLATASLAAQFSTEEHLLHISMNSVYAPHKSPNDWLIASRQ